MCRRLQKEFGERLHKARRAKGDMQKTLAVGMGLSRTSISNIECGAQRVYLDQVFQAAHLLETTVDELLPGLYVVFPSPAIRTSADDPLTPKVAAEAKRVLRSVIGDPKKALRPSSKTSAGTRKKGKSKK